MNAHATPLDSPFDLQRLSIGVTGHRLDRLGDVSPEQVTAAVGQVVATLASALAGRRAPRLVDCLADGADCIVADAALAHGWSLDVVLPFARADYAADFVAGTPLAGYERLLDAAHAVFELPGERDDATGSGAAYERAGRIVLLQSDILIAVWDGLHARGRGGAGQIVSEAVVHGIPVIHVDPSGSKPPLLLWQGLDKADLGQNTVETVPRGALADLPRLVADLLDAPVDGASRWMIDQLDRVDARPRRSLALAFPLLLAVMGVRGLRLSDFRTGGPNDLPSLLRSEGDSAPFPAHIRATLDPRFARADGDATRFAQRFRSAYVTNFSLAALAVVTSLLGLALPHALKPGLILSELVMIATILIVTRIGNRASWHRRWLDNRQIAERLRCIAVSAQLGDPDLRGGGDGVRSWGTDYARATARILGMPSVRVDAAYLRRVRDDLAALIDDQVGYITSDAARMHRLEHRLHRLGAFLFMVTAAICVGFLTFEAVHHLIPSAEIDEASHPVVVAATIISAAFPAVGAAIYGIRMQGDFAGSAERDEALGQKLAVVRRAIAQDTPDYDTLLRRVRQITALLNTDVATFLHAYHARPLTLPG